MKVYCFGTKKYDVQDERTRQRNVGITAHYFANSVDPNVSGKEYGKFSAPAGSALYGFVEALKPPVGLDVQFNHKGKVVDFEVLDEKSGS